jgi:murein DD-endopeptidase MepM/ murein hydrolase activator NlpD
MQKRKKSVSVICLVLVFILIASLLFGALGSALAVSQAQIDTLKSQQSALQQQQQDIQTTISELQGQQNSALAQKAALDRQNELARQEIELINEQIDLYTRLVEQKAAELEAARADEARQKEALRVRMRAMEESGSLTYYAILFEARSFSDLLARISDIASIMKYDRELEGKYVAAREHVEIVKAEYEATLAEQEQKKAELEQKKAELERQITAAEAVIVTLENDIEAYTAEFEKNEAAEAELGAQINEMVAALEKQQREAAAAGQPGYITGTGSMQWPLPGYTGSQTYGMRMHPIFHEMRFHAGTDIGAPSGTPILAADSGTVALATYNSGYGNYVVLSHGNGVSTVYAHMSVIAVSSGAGVTKGQVIGYVGSTGWSTGPHLHFEVRVNDSTTDPLSYTYS